mgnify:CR=1 FL=1
MNEKPENHDKQIEMIFLLQMLILSITTLSMMGFGYLLSTLIGDAFISIVFSAGGFFVAFGIIISFKKTLKRFPPLK